MNRLGVIVAAVLLAGAGGCVRSTYTVQMRPVAAGLERTMTWQRGQASSEAERLSYALPDEQRLALMASLYHRAPEGDPATGATVAAVFKDAMPADVGGFGRHAAYPTSLGTLHIYAERFRGDDDLAGQWERRQRAIDVVLDAAVSWVDEESKGSTGAGALHRFVDQDLRRDAKNAVLYGWLALEAERRAEAEPKHDDVSESEREVIGFGLRMGLYAVERGYMTLEELPRITTSTGVPQEPDDAAVMRLVRRELERRSGAALPPSLAQKLATFTTLSEAMTAYVRAQAAVRERLVAWGREVGVRDGDPAELLAAACRAVMDVPFLVNHDQLVASLSLTREPFFTNGRWDAAQGQVRWEAGLELDSRAAVGLPVVCLALWADADEAAQTERFGRIMLTGRDLGGYCFWRAGLSPDEAQQWDAFLSGLAPREDLSEVVGRFRFRGQEGDQTPPQGASLLMAGLAVGP